jgi:hypothetical protein
VTAVSVTKEHHVAAAALQVCVLRVVLCKPKHCHAWSRARDQKRG